MAVSISRDLTVRLGEDVNTVKLTDRQQELRAAIQRGEPKCLGVSQLMLGLMVMSYSIPLHFTEFTEVITLGVPWWSGLMVSLSSSFWPLLTCILVAVIIYSVDMQKHPEVPCDKTGEGSCSDEHYVTVGKLSRGLKSSLLFFTLAQTVISSILSFLLFRQRRTFGQYASLTPDGPSTPTAVIPPDFN
uniref:Uncharacterized protein n=1 Tax=Acanthochromis polyacanthus TaxID=80966 RepID=A0A3Q1GF69_9TELE